MKTYFANMVGLVRLEDMRTVIQFGAENILELLPSYVGCNKQFMRNRYPSTPAHHATWLGSQAREVFNALYPSDPGRHRSGLQKCWLPATEHLKTLLCYKNPQLLLRTALWKVR